MKKDLGWKSSLTFGLNEQRDGSIVQWQWEENSMITKTQNEKCIPRWEWIKIQKKMPVRVWGCAIKYTRIWWFCVLCIPCGPQGRRACKRTRVSLACAHACACQPDTLVCGAYCDTVKPRVCDAVQLLLVVNRIRLGIDFARCVRLIGEDKGHARDCRQQ